ncbi:domain of Kin17 curved DNA-binding protein-domain-containing protein [Podospora appendiculata]|uniref:Domain of Kin17 curved DNA-binding protein-domain-containing protein n=1 Tax=Podospora appendiculata TaxID=314037 RepID=A0AAE0X5E9_9PEZI|nr:domain of Kin17 curved DNA-binding protein-domain-containing protein [Podospora appendiculata]
MGKAEFGSVKHLSNQQKSRGLNRLRWYCQVCTKSCRDENGYKMHTQSESHTRKVLEVGQNYKSVEEDFSKQFRDEFISLLRTAHGEKEIAANKFYQEVIARRDHVHLNATRWHSLTDFVKSLGRESICRVEEKEDGLFISWINDSPEALARRDAARKRAMEEKGDEEREQHILKEQIKRAQRDAAARGKALEDDEDDERKDRELKRKEGEKIKLSFGLKPAAPTPAPVPAASGETSTAVSESPKVVASPVPSANGAEAESVALAKASSATEPGKEADSKPATDSPAPIVPAAPKPVSMKFGAKPQAKNVFKNAFSGAPKKVMVAQPKKMSEAERIMKEELERKRAREAGGGPPNKRPRF